MKKSIITFTAFAAVFGAAALVARSRRSSSTSTTTGSDITRGAIVHVIGRLKCNQYIDANGNDHIQYEIVARKVVGRMLYTRKRGIEPLFLSFSHGCHSA